MNIYIYIHFPVVLRLLLLWLASWFKAMWEGKGLFLLTACSPSSREVRIGIQGRNLRGRTWSRDHEGVLLTGLLLMACLACFLYNPVLPAQEQHCQQWAGPSHVSYYSRKCPHRLAYRPILWRHCFQLMSLFPNISRFMSSWQNRPALVFLIVSPKQFVLSGLSAL